MPTRVTPELPTGTSPRETVEPSQDAVALSSWHSQPFDTMPSTLNHGVAQLATWQVPVPQVPDACAGEHEPPQVPQLVVDVSAVSQPFESMPSQLPESALQLEIAHVPVEHVAVAFGREQPAPHEPQLPSVLSGVSQPLPALPSQLPQPAAHEAIAHVPVAHVEVAWASEHAVPQPPQLLSVLSGVSQPFAGFPSQLPEPLVHVPSVQVPEAQLAPAFAKSHVMPQPPQSVSVRVLRSQPLVSFRSQSSKPAEQATISHVRFAQVSLAFGRLHVVRHEPQLLSEFSAVSQPLASTPSQSA